MNRPPPLPWNLQEVALFPWARSPAWLARIVRWLALAAPRPVSE